jgi:WD40 repeat protein
MQLYLHPIRHEALTARETTLTRWSLDTNPATILAQLSTAPESLFSRSYDHGCRLHVSGGVTGSPDGLLFAHEHLTPQEPMYWQVMPVLDWRRWENLSLARIGSEPAYRGWIRSMACSPDGRWLVVGAGGVLFLLDWQTGEKISEHVTAGYATSGLSFDPTSTWVAGLSYADGGGALTLWRLVRAEQFVARPPRADWYTHRLVSQDEVSGRMALIPVYEDLDRTGIAWEDRDLADAACQTAFSPDSRVVIFSPMNAGYSACGLELVAYEVGSGKRLWCARHALENSGPFLVSPDGSVLLVPMQRRNLLVYRVEDGALLQQVPTNLDEPVLALAFDHEGKLWLATEERLVQYQPLG